jgi:protein SCO1/2
MKMRVVIALALAVAACDREKAELLPFYRSAEMTPEFLSASKATAKGVHRIGEFALTDQNGQPVTQDAFKGRVTLVHFFFAQCGDICPLTTRNLASALDGIGSAPTAQILSYSITPERDSVPALRAFAAHHKLTDPRWHFLTGDRATIERLARETFYVKVGDGSTYGVKTIAHTESVLLVDREGRLRGVYAASLPLEMVRAVEDARTLLATPGI